MRIGSLCSGYGGLDLAVEHILGGKVAWHADNAPAPTQILSARWPGVPNLGDITRTDWRVVEPIDIATAGYPCQPFSQAGRKQGTADERHLWPYIANAIRTLRPRLVILENVANHRRIGFGDVLGDLAALGYDAQWTSNRAADVGAPHGRERLFVLATTTDTSSNRLTRGAERDVRASESRLKAPHWIDADGRHAATADADPSRLQGPEPTRGLELPTRRATADAAGIRRDQGPGLRDGGPATIGGLFASDSGDDRGFEWADYGPTVDRWSDIIGRRPPNPVVRGRLGGRQVSARFVEWLMGLPDGWVTDVQGLTAKQQIEALGNGVVPQQAEAALQSLLHIAEAAA